MDYVEQGLLKLEGYISIRPPLLTFCTVKHVDAERRNSWQRERTRGIALET